MRVAIVGSGIAGLAAAHALSGAHALTHDVVMYEAAPRAGGHVYTVEADGHAVDMGFIVCNRDRYPRFCALLDELGIATRPTTMSFSVSHDGVEWGSASVSAMFAQRRRLVDPRHWRFLGHVVRFLVRARADLHASATRDPRPTTGLVARASLDEYPAARHVSREIRDRFVVPLAAALWSRRHGAARFQRTRTCASSSSTACCRRSGRCAGTRSPAHVLRGRAFRFRVSRGRHALGARGRRAPARRRRCLSRTGRGLVTAFHSALYRGELVHARHDAVRRAFRYPVYVAVLDLDELPVLHDQLRLFSHRRRNLFSFDERGAAACDLVLYLAFSEAAFAERTLADHQLLFLR
jgi:uncharacterized protein with NAD-binding domain and iron-sulfur cluster